MASGAEEIIVGFVVVVATIGFTGNRGSRSTNCNSILIIIIMMSQGW